MKTTELIVDACTFYPRSYSMHDNITTAFFYKEDYDGVDIPPCKLGIIPLIFEGLPSIGQKMIQEGILYSLDVREDKVVISFRTKFVKI